MTQVEEALLWFGFWLLVLFVGINYEDPTEGP